MQANQQSATSLSELGIEKLIQKQCKTAIVQIIEINKASFNQYNGVISDGYAKINAIFAMDAAKKINQLNLGKNSIIQILTYEITLLPNKIINIQGIQPIYEKVKQQIGIPILIDDFLRFGRQNKQGDNQIPEEIIVSQAQPQMKQFKFQQFQNVDLDDSNCMPLSTLSPMMNNNWKIKARVIQKSSIKEYQNARGQGKLFSIDIIDEGQTEMKCTFFNEGVDKFYNMLEQGKVYIFSRGTIKFNNQKYSNKNDYSITFDQKAEIFLTEDKGDIDQNKFKFTNLEEIITNEKYLKLKGLTFDIIAIIKDEGKAQTINIKSTGQDKERKTVLVYDQTSYGIELTLWGDQAQVSLPPNSIVIFKEVALSEFNKVRILVASFTTQIITDIKQLEQLNEYKQLKYWLENNKQVELLIARPEQKADLSPLLITEMEDRAINTLQKPDDKIYCDLLCSPIYVKTDGPLYYLACEKCQKKIVEETIEGKQQYHCMSCNQIYDKCDARYIFSVKIADCSGSQWVSFYDKVGQDLLQVPADEIRKLKEENKDDEIKKIFNKVCLKEIKMKVLAKFDVYEGNSRIRYQAIRIEQKPNYAKENEALFKDLLAYENLDQ